ncbi:unnamed protein product [Chilo suppressalis]|uniref:Major facilitator superfamily (MFS) profile domain-containing protein n=1 Tax=Chilo suppressalis TaxID=168631 RepID=A0ABN8B0J4_CHISP|nr:unnamed protein product [Chilo suppressalis]
MPTPKQNEPRKSILVVPSRVVSRPDDVEGGEETEIAAQISVPQEGGWGWIVVIASFWCAMILDGIVFTFGSLLSDMTNQLGVSESLVLLINSVAIALYFFCGPLASAFINRFGFRACAMSGSVICSCSLFLCYFVTNYFLLIVFYGVLAGFGYCLINMASALVVGFYFEKLRSIALSLATSGSSAGVSALFPLNDYLVGLAGWQTTTLLHSGLLGTIFFVSMAFRPLLSLTVIKTSDDPTRTVTYLPNLSKVAVPSAPSSSKIEGLKPTAAERLFSAVSNVNFPTAAAVVEDELTKPSTQPGPSTAAASKLTLTAHHPQGVSRRHIKQVQSLMSRTSVQDKTKNIEVVINVEERPKKRSCWARLCHWEEHVPQSRPLYRDDAFYDGNIEKLPIYQKSMMDTGAEAKTGLEYQLAVSRAITAGDLHEHRGVFTTAARRVLATMMDPALLKRRSFLVLSCSGFLVYLGFLVPYIYIKERSLNIGIDQNNATILVSVLGIANAMGRLVVGALAAKIDPLKLYTVACFVGGLSTILSNCSYNMYYQYGYVSVYGFFAINLVSLRSMVIVSMFGLDKLTSATGMMLLFVGCGSLISTPLAGVIKSQYGYSMAFYVAGIFIVGSGFVSLSIYSLIKKERLKERLPERPAK